MFSTVRLTLVAALVSSALPTSAESLVDILALSTAKDPEFRAVEAAYRAVVELRPQARAQLLLPEIALQANTQYNEQDIDSSFSFGSQGGGEVHFNSRGWSVNLRQPVYHYDRWIALKQADSRIAEAEIAVAAARQDLMLRTAQRYFLVLTALDNLHVAQAEKTALSRQLEQTLQRFEVGLIAITDVQESQAAYDAAVADEIRAQNLLDNSFEALRELTGQSHRELAVLSENSPLAAPEPADIEQWAAIALAQNLRLKQALTSAETAAAEIERQQAGHHPTLDIVGSTGYGRQGGRFGSTSIDADAIGIELNLPIYTGGQVLSRTREARALHEKAIEDLERERRATEREARDAYLGVLSGVSRVTALKQAVISSQTAVTATTAGFEVGTRTSVDVVAAERELSRARRDYAVARYDYIQDTLRLKLAAGTLSDEDLKLVDTWLEKN
jgi:outer membrane protein